MNQEERTGVRIPVYGVWHRPRSIARFVGIERAQLLTMVDVDACATLFLEHHPVSKEPLCLIECARDSEVAHPWKPATAIMRLARRAGIPAYAVLFTMAAAPNVADPRFPDIERFRVRRLFPRLEREWRTLTPAQWAAGLVAIREYSARRLDLQAANDPYWR